MARRCPGLMLIIGLFLGSSAPAGTQSPDPIHISGRVGDSRGSAVEDARVALVQMIYAESAFVPDPKTAVETTTSANGTFTLAIPQGVDPKKESYVVARKEGLALGWSAWRVQDNQRIDVALGQGEDLAGQVVDEKGEPVADAQLRVSAAMAAGSTGRKGLVTPAFLRARTDAEGRFVFKDMRAQATFEFFVEKPGRAQINTLRRMASVQNGYQFSPGRAGIKVVLPLEAVVEGMVAKSDGRPIAGASVVALPTSGEGMLLSPRPAVTAQDGAFRIGGLAADAYSVQIAVPRERAGDWTAEPARVALQAGQTRTGVKLELARYGAIEVFVSEPADGPISNADVSVFTVLRDQRFNGFTDANGLTRIRVPPGEYQVTGVRKEGYGRATIENEVITVGDGRTMRVECALRRSRATGTVRDPTGNPLSGVKLAVLPMSRSVATSDSSGRFEIAWDPMPFPGDDTPFVLVARDMARNLALAVDLSGELDNLDIKLKPGVTFVGTVLDQEGKTLPRARVRVQLHMSSWIVHLDANETILDGPDGVFEMRAVPTGRQYSVSAAADGYGRLEIPVDASGPKDGRWEVGPFKLLMADQSITGVVVDSSGEPVAEAEIFAYGEGQPDPWSIQTDGGGGFVIQRVCKGLLRLHVSTNKSPILYGNAEVEAGATGVKIVISEKGEKTPFIPRRPASLRGRPLPPLEDVGIDLPADAEGKILLVCFWDMAQRPSRNCVTQLAARAAELGEKNVSIVAVQVAKGEGDASRRWIEENKIPFPMGRIPADADAGEAQFAWGFDSLPHLILTDRKHVVVAEGFSLADLDNQIEAAAGR